MIVTIPCKKCSREVVIEDLCEEHAADEVLNTIGDLKDPVAIERYEKLKADPLVKQAINNLIDQHIDLIGKWP